MRTLKHLFIAFVALATLAAVIFGIGLWNFRERALRTKGDMRVTAMKAAQAMKDMEPHRAGLYLAMIQGQLAQLNEALSLWRGFIPFLGSVADELHGAQGLANASVEIADDLDFLKRNGTQLILTGKGPEFIAALKRLRANIERVAPTANKEEVYAALSMIDASIAWLDARETQNILVLFQNPSEIRPGGGFLGSFAHLSLNHASLTSLEVQDIYDPDGQLVDKIIPPIPLQKLTTNWGARDANWFADYPTSARKVMRFLEASRIYRDRNMRFSGAIAINVNLIGDVLAITGPLEIPQADGTTLTLDAETFVAALQEDVETKQSKGIVKQATPALFAKLSSLDDEGKKALVTAIGKRIANKDVMAYFGNPVMEAYMQGLGAGGELYPTPERFPGSYLAVVYANIAGGKTDAYATQSLTLDETVHRDGTVVDRLTIERTNGGNVRTERWYNAMSRTYVQLMTAPRTTLTSLTGGYSRDIKPAIDYAKAGYVSDPDLAADGGKETFSTWIDIDPGQTKTISASYSRETGLTFDALETPYTFVFDKQSGIDGPLTATFHAPNGMVWKESGASTFTYATENPPARVSIPLTVIRR